MSMKICKICGKEKPLNEFGKCNRMKDGHLNQCKKCKYEKYRNSKTFICKHCDKEFHSHDKNAKFCSRECSNLHKTTSIKINCEFCGKEMLYEQNLLKRNKHYFCSRECCLHYKTNNNYFKGENNPRYNHNLTNEEREQKRNYEEYIKWRKLVYERDNYTCQCCRGTKSNSFNAHHLNSYDWCKKERTSVDNGVTLCNECHKSFHSIYGYGKNTREQFTNFLNLIHGNTEVSQEIKES